nr:hypothetical protein [Clavibacter michiganensis]
MELVGPPRTLIREAKADLRAHRRSVHSKQPATAEPGGDWRDRLSNPPQPHTLPELMLLVLDLANHDAAHIANTPGPQVSARDEFEALAGYDLYDQLRDLLTGPLFTPPSSSDPDGPVKP